MSARHGVDSARERLNADLPNALLVLSTAIEQAEHPITLRKLQRLRLFVLTGRAGGAS